MICKNDGCDNETAIQRTKGKEYSLPHCHACRNFMSKYGITNGDRMSMLEEQDWACGICKKEVLLIGTWEKNAGKAAVIDHCHDTGRVRGILCNHCNKTLGSLNDNPEWLRNAIEWLK